MKVYFCIFCLVSGSLGSPIPNLSGLLWAFSAPWLQAVLGFWEPHLGSLGSPIPNFPGLLWAFSAPWLQSAPGFWGPRLGSLGSLGYLSILVGVSAAVASVVRGAT